MMGGLHDFRQLINQPIGGRKKSLYKRLKELVKKNDV